MFEVGLSRFRASHDAVVRGNVLRGISSTTDAALGARALELALDDDLRVNEVFRPLMAQTGQPETRTAAYAWVTEHYDAISERIGPSTAGYLSYTGVGFCSAEQAGTVQGFFEPRAANTLGGPRNLELVIERIRLCASRAEYARTTLEGAF